MPAPRQVEELARYVDEQFTELRNRVVFPIFAEQNAALTAATFQWGFGDAGTVNAIILPMACQLFALSLYLTGGTARASVDVERDGTVETDYNIDLTASNYGFVEFYKPLDFFQGSRLRFRTVTQANTAAGNVVSAWFRTI